MVCGMFLGAKIPLLMGAREWNGCVGCMGEMRCGLIRRVEDWDCEFLARDVLTIKRCQ